MQGERCCPPAPKLSIVFPSFVVPPSFPRCPLSALLQEFENLKGVRSEADYTAGLVDQCATQVGIQFSQWFQETYGQSVVEAFAAAEEEIARALNEAEFEAQEQAAEQNDAMGRTTAKGGDEDAFIAAQRVARKVSAPTIKRKGPKGTF